MKIGIIKEGKVPSDKRVPLSPNQCKQINAEYSDVEIVVQSSDIRCFTDKQYESVGIKVVDDIDDCDVILGVKEVPKNMLINNKTFFFFSHTIKKQPYNADLLRKVLEKNIHLVDYECLTNTKGRRLIGFGRYAGVVGAYNGFLTYGERFNQFKLKPAYQCDDRKEMESELDRLPKLNIKVLLTGTGRVSKGAREILDYLKYKEVSPNDFMNKSFDYPVYSNPDIEDLYELKTGGFSTKQDYYNNPEKFYCKLNTYLSQTDMLITGHVWSPKYPKILSNEDLRNPSNKMKVIADITCDIDDPIACTIRPCIIGEPYFEYDFIQEKEVATASQNTVSVMSVDNLPCELPKDASEDFGNEYIQHILPALTQGDKDEIIKRASITKNGKLTDLFAYLTDYVS